MKLGGRNAVSEREFVPLAVSLMLNRGFDLDDETTRGSQNRMKKRTEAIGAKGDIGCCRRCGR